MSSKSKNHTKGQASADATHAAKDAGVQINLVSRRFLGTMTSAEKIRFILDEVKGNKILVLEQGLDPREEAELIQTTMREIQQDAFIGIEMDSHQHETPNTWMEKLLARGGIRRSNLTVVGPADMLRTVHKDGSTLRALILGGPGEVAPVAAAAG